MTCIGHRANATTTNTEHNEQGKTMQDTAAHQTAEAIAQAASDAAIAKLGLGAGVSGGLTAVFGGMTMSAVGIIFGMVIGTLGFAVQWYYTHRKTTVEIRLREEAAARDAEEHRARMGMY